MKLMDKAKQAALAAAVKTGLGYLEKDPEVNIPKLMELVDKFVPDGWYEAQRNAIRNAIHDKNSNWYKPSPRRPSFASSEPSRLIAGTKFFTRSIS